MTPARRAVLDRVAAAVLALPAQGTARVGIDGVDGAGKTAFADELRDRLASSGRPLIRAGVDPTLPRRPAALLSRMRAVGLCQYRRAMTRCSP